METFMKPQILMAGLLSAYAIPGATAPSTGNTVETEICSVFETQKRTNLIANYSRQLDDGSQFCAKLLKTDDHHMFELILFKKDKAGDVSKFGDNTGDDVRIYLILNSKNSSQHQKSYVGITCNSSQGCETGETFIANFEEKGQELYLRLGKYSNTDSQRLSFLPSDFVEGLSLQKE